MEIPKNEVIENTTLATELLREVKSQSKRWFITAVVELVIIVIITLAFLWYISLPVDETLIQTDDGNANYIGRDLNGELFNGENSSYQESSEK